MAKSINTIEGREALACIVKRARGKKGVRAFAKEAGVSHSALLGLEKALTKDPRDSTLAAIAPFTGFSFEDLKAILMSRSSPEIHHYRTAQEVWAIVQGLLKEEKALLGQMILADLGGLPIPGL